MSDLPGHKQQLKRGQCPQPPQTLRIEEAVDRGHWSQAMGSSWSSDGGSSPLLHPWALSRGGLGRQTQRQLLEGPDAHSWRK